MKTKLILLFIFVLFSYNLPAQEAEDSNRVKYKLNKITVEVNSLDQLKSIDWEKVLNNFDDNTLGTDSIEIDLIFEPEESISNVKIENFSLSVKGDHESKGEMIQNMVKFLTFMEKLLESNSSE